MAKRGDWIRYTVGSKRDDDLNGTAGKDIVVGRRGDDSIDGGAGNDILFGDDIFGGSLWGCRFGGWWHARGSGNDYLDGGAGSDRVFAGRGDDFANYTLAENLRSHDAYDGGKGFDTLQLTLTQSEFLTASVQQDIAAFQKFLDHKANPYSDHGKTFHFKSFDLDARNFEALKIDVVNAVNTVPTARDDVATTDEDTPLAIAAPGLLANDTDPDYADTLAVTSADATSARGVAVVVGADGSITYDASGLFEYLAAGETIADSFDYTIADLGGATASATARITVTGVNDAPVAADDIIAPEGPVSLPEERLITFEAQSNPPANVDGYAFAGFTVFGFAGVGGTSMAAASTGNNNAGGGFDADGAVQRVDGGDFALHSLSIASMSFEPTVTIVGYNDGTPVPGAEFTPLAPLEGAYHTFVFDAAWGNVDEVRFYGTVAEPEGDYLMIDNLQVSSGGSGASGHSEDVPLDIDVLANDTDVDSSDVLHVSGFSATSKMGAAISLNADGTLHYDPTEADDIQLLAQGETATDTFEYTACDDHGGTSIATVSIALLGVDEPDASLSGALSAPDVDLV